MLFIAALMGPGIITAVADNDAAGISTYSLAASNFGYQILIILIPMTILLAVTQEIGARIAIVAEKGLADLIREQFGVRVALWMYGLLFFINLVVIITDVSGIKSALALFGLNPLITLPLIIAGLYFLSSGQAILRLKSFSYPDRILSYLYRLCIYGQTRLGRGSNVAFCTDRYSFSRVSLRLYRRSRYDDHCVGAVFHKFVCQR